LDWQELITNFLNPPDTYPALTFNNVLLALVITFIINLLIYNVYRKTFKGVVYNRDFNVSLVLISLVVTLVVLPIRSNLSLALGMVGALSIVRFRTTIKDPKDVVFTFWSIAVGIVCGSGLYLIALVGVPLMAFMLYVLEQTSVHGPEHYLLVVHYANEAEEAVQRALPKYKLRSRTADTNGVELMGEVILNASDVPSLDKLLKIKGVRDASVMSYTSDSA
jgi:hypothetical protein